ncbi:hypothetical protein GC102_33340 [Paenibacillus sp. LMG 31460]|uniref:Uncharacterized protein n=1 Tax=Paenibacillus germinis TaxID=2654979 RepID=A0ABX1ZF02_9BACL|nr:hypothetical protein [Paenibacillus germinis]NOU90578.1 hypothetical protein [Paenibacillus germinis]
MEKANEAKLHLTGLLYEDLYKDEKAIVETGDESPLNPIQGRGTYPVTARLASHRAGKLSPSIQKRLLVDETNQPFFGFDHM